MSAFKIREAQGEDLPAILHLINSSSSGGKILKRTRKEVRKVLRSFAVAEVDGQVVACGSFEIYNKKLGEIRSLVVATEYRRRGIATALIKRFIDIARKKEIYEVLAITDRAKVFSPHGFSQQLQGQKALFLRP
ncbi:MAG: Amino-acid acetyltransferase [Elusimicrobia bacterium]|nr:Amino-acid acetyltransferase [Elusimicrobiota bacterium]